MRPLFFWFFFGSVALAGIAVAACASDSGTTSDGDDAASESGKNPGHPDSGGDDGAADAGEDAPGTCAIEKAFYVGCGLEKDLTCGPDKFDVWCAANDTAINSAAFRRGEAKCLTTANCDAKARHDCEYQSYATATPTAAQTAVVTAYCQTCEPADLAGCKTRSTGYSSALGPDSVGDIFVAAWELGDSLTDEIRTTCTGAALDGGADAAGCAKAFGNCSGDIYINHLPDCP